MLAAHRHWHSTKPVGADAGGGSHCSVSDHGADVRLGQNKESSDLSLLIACLNALLALREYIVMHVLRILRG